MEQRTDLKTLAFSTKENVKIDQSPGGELGLYSTVKLSLRQTVFAEITEWFCPINENLLVFPFQPEPESGPLTVSKLFPDYDQNIHGQCSAGILAWMMSRGNYVPKRWETTISENSSRPCEIDNCCSQLEKDERVSLLHSIIVDKGKIFRSLITNTPLSFSYFPIISCGNHSCDPNCELVLDYNFARLVTLRDINVGEQITYNYNIYDFVPNISKLQLEVRGIRCRCSFCVARQKYSIRNTANDMAQEFLKSSSYTEDLLEDESISEEQLLQKFTDFVVDDQTPESLQRCFDSLQRCFDLEKHLTQLLEDSVPNMVSVEEMRKTESTEKPFVESLWEFTLRSKLEEEEKKLSQSTEEMRLWVLILLECCKQLLVIGKHTVFKQVYDSLCSIKPIIPVGSSVLRVNDELVLLLLDFCYRLLFSPPPVGNINEFMGLFCNYKTIFLTIVPSMAHLFSDSECIAILSHFLNSS